MPVSSTGGEYQRKILLALEVLIDQDVEESDEAEEGIDNDD